MINTRNTLGRSERLKSRKLIEEVFENGKAINMFPFRIGYLVQSEPVSLQAGFGVSSRNFKKATDRNRIKRLMKEAYRLRKGGLRDSIQTKNCSLVLFILYTGKEIPDLDFVIEKVHLIIQRFIKVIHEIPPQAS